MYPWLAAFNCTSKLIVLRLFFTTFAGISASSQPIGTGTSTHRLFNYFLAVVAVLFTGTIISWSVSSAHAVAASHFFQLVASNASDADSLNRATEEFNLLNEAQAYGNHFESSYLILTSVTFVIIGLFSARRMHKHALLLQDSASTAGKRGTASQQRFIILAALISLRRSNSVVSTTTLIIFISHLINAAYAILYSIASAGKNFPNCTDLCDATCQSTPAMLNHVLRLTPALTAAVLLLSFVVAPLLALANIMRGRIWYILSNRALPGSVLNVKACPAAL